MGVKYYNLELECLDYLEIGGDNDGERDDEAKDINEEDIAHMKVFILASTTPLDTTAVK